MRSLKDQPGFNRLDIQIRIYLTTQYFEMLVYERVGQFDKALDMLEPIREKMKDFGDKITKEDEVLFEHLFANVYFGAGKYREALRQLNTVLNDSESNLRQDIYSFVKLFNLVIHYELNNFDLLDYLVKSTERFYLKRKKLAETGYKFEMMFIRSFKQLVKPTRSASQNTQTLKQMLDELKTLMSDQNERVALEYFDYLTWIEAKIDNRSYGELKKHNHRNVKLS
jgi:tetratricopeptide (TPR) repeat protein